MTNFVLHELGQPLHAFDYDQIAGKTIIVKKIKPGTPFITLDGTTRTLNGTELMICDQAGGISMAGILGGKRTRIDPDTQNIFLESAYFAPSLIRKAAKQHAVQTDASFRYERGTDPKLTVYALKRACPFRTASSDHNSTDLCSRTERNPHTKAPGGGAGCNSCAPCRRPF